MAVIIHFPVHARVLADGAPKRQSAEAVVLPFARVRNAKARRRAIGAPQNDDASAYAAVIAPWRASIRPGEP
jgi:hypothetical protein